MQFAYNPFTCFAVDEIEDFAGATEEIVSSGTVTVVPLTPAPANDKEKEKEDEEYLPDASNYSLKRKRHGHTATPKCAASPEDKEKREERRIVQAGDHKQRSVIWLHFTIVEPNRVHCRLCNNNKTIAISKSSTSNLWAHLATTHPKIRDQILNVNAKATNTIDTHLAFDAKTQKMLHTYALLFLLDKNVAFSAFDKPNYGSLFLNKLQPRYQPYCGAQYYEHARRLEVNVRDKIRAIVKNKDMSLTFDLWTSIATEGYLGVTGHYISSDWTLKRYTLGMEHIQSRHTGIAIKDMIKKITR